MTKRLIFKTFAMSCLFYFGWTIADFMQDKPVGEKIYWLVPLCLVAIALDIKAQIDGSKR